MPKRSKSSRTPVKPPAVSEIFRSEGRSPGPESPQVASLSRLCPREVIFPEQSPPGLLAMMVLRISVAPPLWRMPPPSVVVVLLLMVLLFMVSVP